MTSYTRNTIFFSFQTCSVVVCSSRAGKFCTSFSTLRGSKNHLKLSRKIDNKLSIVFSMNVNGVDQYKHLLTITLKIYRNK